MSPTVGNGAPRAPESRSYGRRRPSGPATYADSPSGATMPAPPRSACEPVGVEEALVVGERRQQGGSGPWGVGQPVRLDGEQRRRVPLRRPKGFGAPDQRLHSRRGGCVVGSPSLRHGDHPGESGQRPARRRRPRAGDGGGGRTGGPPSRWRRGRRHRRPRTPAPTGTRCGRRPRAPRRSPPGVTPDTARRRCGRRRPRHGPRRRGAAAGRSSDGPRRSSPPAGATGVINASWATSTVGSRVVGSRSVTSRRASTYPPIDFLVPRSAARPGGPSAVCRARPRRARPDARTAHGPRPGPPASSDA